MHQRTGAKWRSEALRQRAAVTAAKGFGGFISFLFNSLTAEEPHFGKKQPEIF